MISAPGHSTFEVWTQKSFEDLQTSRELTIPTWLLFMIPHIRHINIGNGD